VPKDARVRLLRGLRRATVARNVTGLLHAHLTARRREPELIANEPLRGTAGVRRREIARETTGGTRTIGVDSQTIGDMTSVDMTTADEMRGVILAMTVDNWVVENLFESARRRFPGREHDCCTNIDTPKDCTIGPRIMLCIWQATWNIHPSTHDDRINMSEFDEPFGWLLRIRSL
jgi:hypothetical protein